MASGTAGGSGTVILQFISPTGVLVKIGNQYYNIKLGSLNIDNSIGERGTCSFQIMDTGVLAEPGTAAIFNKNGEIIGTVHSPPFWPDIGTRIVFTGDTPPEITQGANYYIVYRFVSGVFVKVSPTYGGAPTTWTPGSFLNTTYDTYTNYSFSIGQNIEIYISGGLVWSGVIERINKQLPLGQSTILYTIRGVSWNYALDKRRIVSTYSTDITDPLYAGDIVEDLVDNYLAGEGISTGIISSGAALGNVVFNYIQPSKCLDILAEQSGYIWQINPDKTLDFKPHEYSSFTFGVGSTEIIVDNMQYTRTNPKYRNVQYITGGYDLTNVSTEVQWGDSTKQTFVVPYVLMKEPTINVSLAGSTGTDKSIGILGINTTEEWFWNKFSNIVSQNATDSPLSTLQRFKAVYTGGFPSLAVSLDTTAIASRQSAEGGTGIVEDVLNRGKETIYADNLTLGNALISKYATMTDVLTFRTRTHGISPGKILKVNVPEFELSSEKMLIDTVRIRDESNGSVIWYDVSALTGPEHGGWAKYFDDFLTRTIERDIWANALTGEIVLVTTNWAETFTWTEATTESIFACRVPAPTSTSLFPETTEYPC